MKDEYNKQYTFELPLFETLVREGKKIQGDSKKLYDLNNKPLKLRDTTGTLVMGFGIEKLKFEK